MQHYKRIIVIAAIGIVGIAYAVYAASTGEAFVWLSTDSSGHGITIGAEGDPGANYAFMVTRVVNQLTRNAWLRIAPNGLAEFGSTIGGYMTTNNANNYIQSTSSGTSQMLGKPTGGSFATAQAHWDGSVYELSSANSAMTVDNDGSVWMQANTGNSVSANADGSSSMASDAGSSVTTTNSGDVVIHLGEAPGAMMMMEGGGRGVMAEGVAEEAVLGTAEAIEEIDPAAAAQERAERIAAIREEAEYERPAPEE